MVPWSQQRIEWYQRAVAYTHFDRLLADAIVPYLPKGETVCDLGCGTGYLAMELARRGYAATAFDANELTQDYVRQEAKRRGLPGLTPQRGSWFDLPREPHWDHVVMVFAGHLDQDLSLFLSLCRKQLILVLKDGDDSHVQADGVSLLKHVPAQQVEAQLGGYRYLSFDLKAPFGQPLKSEKECRAYLTAFGVDTHSADSALHRVQESDDPLYPLYLPNEKRMKLFVIEKGSV
jgi:SAM-dependent methyltransferase